MDKKKGKSKSALEKAFGSLYNAVMGAGKKNGFKADIKKTRGGRGMSDKALDDLNKELFG